MRILDVVGARSNLMKVAPIMKEMSKYPDKFERLLVHTGPHYDDEMSRVFFDELPAARPVNDGMPLHVADLVVGGLHEAGKDIHGAKVAVLGYTYLENSDDTRNSPSVSLIERLRELGAEVVVHDPYVKGYDRNLAQVVAGTDCIVVMVSHDGYRGLDLTELSQVLRTPVFIDGRNTLSRQRARKAGFIFRVLGSC